MKNDPDNCEHSYKVIKEKTNGDGSVTYTLECRFCGDITQKTD